MTIKKVIGVLFVGLAFTSHAANEKGSLLPSKEGYFSFAATSQLCNSGKSSASLEAYKRQVLAYYKTKLEGSPAASASRLFAARISPRRRCHVWRETPCRYRDRCSHIPCSARCRFSAKRGASNSGEPATCCRNPECSCASRGMSDA